MKEEGGGNPSVVAFCAFVQKGRKFHHKSLWQSLWSVFASIKSHPWVSATHPFTPRKNNCGMALESKELWRREGWSSNGFMLTREHFSLQHTFYLGGWVNGIRQKTLGLDLRQ